jgi:hypothetical protein
MVWALLYDAPMLGAFTSENGRVGTLKSRRAMLETLVRHLEMVRLSVTALAVFALVGCTGLIDDDQDKSLTPEEIAARKAYNEKARPHLDAYCASCHSGTDPSIAFLEGADPMAQRRKLLDFDPAVVNFEAAQSSRILTKGAHSGPGLTSQQSSDILQWITAERDAAGATGTLDSGLETARFTPILCTSGEPGSATCPFTYVDISNLVPGWAGTRIKFVATPLSQDLYVTWLSIEGGPEGVYLEHPLFVSWPPEGNPVPDGFDRFFNVKLNMMPNAEEVMIGGGTAAFIDFAPTNQLTIHFKVVDRYRPDPDTGTEPGTGAIGCRQLASFITNARTPIQNNCGSCHANVNNGNARGALDIVGIASTDDTVLQQVCNQVRTRINFQDTNNSGFYLAPNPSVQSSHPFKFGGSQANFDAFKAAVDPWVQAERTSP